MNEAARRELVRQGWLPPEQSRALAKVLMDLTSYLEQQARGMTNVAATVNTVGDTLAFIHNHNRQKEN